RHRDIKYSRSAPDHARECRIVASRKSCPWWRRGHDRTAADRTGLMTPLNILIVDDEPLAREGLRMLLHEEEGVGDVWEAKSGAEAVTAMRTCPPDVVFLDVQMP